MAVGTPSVVANAKTMQAFCPQPPPDRPPGAGTSRLARRLTTRLPAMISTDALDTTPHPHVAGFTDDCTAFMAV